MIRAFSLLTVCGLDDLESHADSGVTHVLSILDPDREDHPAFARYGDWRNALARWEAILVDHPRDLVALRLAQYSTLYKGDGEGLRDSVGRVMHAWDDGVPGYGFVLGSYAFVAS